MDTWSAGAICTLVFSGFVFAGLCALAYLVWKRREMQALKIKSPTLLTIFLIANIATVVLLTLVQLNLELYYSFGVAKRAGLITAA
jgi:hypothetical protein